MNDYFTGPERLEVFGKTGAPMRMGSYEVLKTPDYQVVKNLITKGEWEQALAYLTIFHAQNVGMNSLIVQSCLGMTFIYSELTSKYQEALIRDKVIDDYHQLIDLLGKGYSENDEHQVVFFMKNFFTKNNLSDLNATELVKEMDKDFEELKKSIESTNTELAIKMVDVYNHHSVIRHDSLISFNYSYPTTVMSASGEEIAIKVINNSVLKNPIWNGLWELTRVLTPADLAAFLGEHLRFHFSGETREGKTEIIEDDKKIRLIFNPCGSGGALRRRIGNEVKNLQNKHNLGWNKTGEVNLYCSHCALNEKHSIDLFGYPKLVVEFEADPNKPCGWTMYKNSEDVPAEVFERLGLKKL